jgi:Tol biopolymer transport system component/tRNA A-37 threonylcarbamoyl transferase component Bud32
VADARTWDAESPVTDTRWVLVKALFQATVERPLSERAAFLAATAGDDETLRREVQSLLDADCSEMEFTDRLTFRDTAPLTLESLLTASEPAAGAERALRIGPYRILREIGRGGMATVYLATRDDGEYRKDVAIKVVQNAFASDFIVQRLRQERQILAGLEHQNIARLLDGGSGSDGLPYLVMEHIAGSPIDEYCDEHRLSLIERLRLFCDVCSAVSYAHERFVIHRDLKPSNILVTAEGKPKLLDFGIAKLLDGSAQQGDRTVTLCRMMTPEYASPEQLRGEPVGVPADVYALGVLLYRLVTGRSPYRAHSDPPHELARAICEDEPEIPSAVRRRLQSTGPGQRSGGDLDAIVMKALAKEPEGRYGSVERFADDVRRCLEGRPILARRATVAQRAWKFVGRNRSRSLSSAVLMVAIAVLTIVVGDRSRKSGVPDRPVDRPLSAQSLTTFGQTVSSPAFSPDGNFIAFSWSGGANQSNEKPGIFTMSVAGSPPTRVTSGLGGERWPVWSPDGSRIAFVRSEMPGQCGIFLVPAQGGPERRLLDLRDDRYYWLAWSPDGHHLAFAERESPRDPYILSLLSLDTLERRRLPASALRFAFSPDGSALALIGGGPGTIDVSLLSLTDGKTRSIYSQREWIGGLAWTADGQALVLSLNQHGIRRLAKLSITASTVELLPVAGEDSYYPAVSRRGDRLAFVREFSDTDLWRVELQNPLVPGQPNPLVSSTRGDGQPSFSPDGKRIAFQSNRSGSFEIWVSNADGSNQVQLTSLNGPPASRPRWSPDGRYVAFLSGDIYVVPADGGTPSRFNAQVKGGELPAWSTDGRWLYFTSSSNVWKVPAQEGTAVQITKNGGASPRESRDGQYLYYSKDDGIWRIPVSGGQETRVIEEFPHYLSDYWDVVDQGIYFVDDKTSPYPTIRFFDFARRQKTTVATLAGPAVPWEGGLTVSPDRRSIVYTQGTYTRSEIMLVENFR